MSVDTEIGKEIVYHTLENGNADATFSLMTTMFTTQQILDAMNQRQERFLRDTGMIVKWVSVAATGGEGVYDLPADTIIPRAMTWTDSSLTTKALTRTDTWELDNGASGWPANQDTPLTWYESNLQSLRVGISPTPLDVGSIGLMYVQLPPTLLGPDPDNPPFFGTSLVVPDDWTPYIKWGTMADLLNQQGEGYDPIRAGYCDTRYQEGVELARLILQG